MCRKQWTERYELVLIDILIHLKSVERVIVINCIVGASCSNAITSAQHYLEAPDTLLTLVDLWDKIAQREGNAGITITSINQHLFKNRCWRTYGRFHSQHYWTQALTVF